MSLALLPALLASTLTLPVSAVLALLAWDALQQGRGALHTLRRVRVLHTLQRRTATHTPWRLLLHPPHTLTLVELEAPEDEDTVPLAGDPPERHDLASQLTTAPIRKISRLGHGMVEDVEEGMADGVSFYRVWLQGGPAPVILFRPPLRMDSTDYEFEEISQALRP